jgi:hypothetical protein
MSTQRDKHKLEAWTDWVQTSTNPRLVAPKYLLRQFLQRTDFTCSGATVMCELLSLKETPPKSKFRRAENSDPPTGND